MYPNICFPCSGAQHLANLVERSPTPNTFTLSDFLSITGNLVELEEEYPPISTFWINSLIEKYPTPRVVN
ncbi:MAG: hypothetical protein ACJ0DE_03420 [Dehalococcoidia bacterium]